MKRIAPARPDAAKVFLALLWLVCVYRAVTQSIVHDEALTWEIYLAGPVSAMFTFFDANHHFLNTVLMRVSTGVLGLSEFSMRLPALCGAALYFAAVYRIACRLFSGWRAPAAAAALTLNPIVLDFMVAARGYGMAMALWMWAFATLLPLFEGKMPSARAFLEASIAVSLSVAANLVFLFPAATLAGSVVVFALKRRPEVEVAVRGRAKKTAVLERPASVWRWFVAPILGCALVFVLVAPIDVARSADFYAGSASLRESLRSLASMSLLYTHAARSAPYATVLRDAVAFVLAPAIVLAGIWTGARRRDLLILIPALVAAGSGLLLVAGHLASGMPLPLDRTGLYFPVLLMLVSLLLVRASGPAAWIPILLATAIFAAQFNVRSFYVWEYDADSRPMAEQVAAQRTSGTPESVRIGGSWQLEPALNFYRVKNGWTWLAPMERAAIAPGFPLYALGPGDRAVVQALHLRTLYTGPRSGSVLAAAQ